MTAVELGGAMMLHSVGLCQVIMKVFANATKEPSVRVSCRLSAQYYS